MDKIPDAHYETIPVHLRTAFDKAVLLLIEHYRKQEEFDPELIPTFILNLTCSSILQHIKQSEIPYVLTSQEQGLA